MKCTVLHESGRRMRIHLPKTRLSLRQADIAEYYIKSLNCIKDAHVNDRTCNAIVIFNCPTSRGKQELYQALETFRFDDEEIGALVPEETGRELNRRYEDRLVMMVVARAFRKLFLPPPIRAAIAVFKAIPFIYRGLQALVREGLTVSVLDAVAIGASIIRRDFKTAESVMFLLNIGDLLEEWTRKKSVNDLALTLSLKVDKVWVRTDSGEIQVDISKVQAGDEIILRSSDVKIGRAHV